MRLRNVKNKDNIMATGRYYIDNPMDYKGIWNNVFSNNNPIYIEIGMGKGDFIVENAKNNPDINYIGIEKYDSVIVRAIQKSNELELDNLKLIRLDAIFLDKVFDKEVDLIYLNFSDPWPKDRHEKRRLTSYNFLSIYDNIFKDRARIEMKTDNIDLFNYSLGSLENYGYDICYVTNDLHKENVYNVMTEYEKKFSSLGVKINKFIAIK